MKDLLTRYQTAEHFLPGHVEGLVLNGEPKLRRSPAGIIYYASEYRNSAGGVGLRYLSVDTDGQASPLFDHAALADALHTDADCLRLENWSWQDGVLLFDWGGGRYRFTPGDGTLERLALPRPELTLSPDGSLGLFSAGSRPVADRYRHRRRNPFDLGRHRGLRLWQAGGLRRFDHNGPLWLCPASAGGLEP